VEEKGEGFYLVHCERTQEEGVVKDINSTGARCVALVETEKGLHVGYTCGHGLSQACFQSGRRVSRRNPAESSEKEDDPLSLHET